jgi:hypothetical protein
MDDSLSDQLAKNLDNHSLRAGEPYESRSLHYLNNSIGWTAFNP